MMGFLKHGYLANVKGGFNPFRVGNYSGVWTQGRHAVAGLNDFNPFGIGARIRASSRRLLLG